MMICSLNKKQIIVVCGLIFFAVVVTGVATTLYLNHNDEQSSEISYLSTHPHGAAVTNGPECAGVARDIIYKGGTVVDAGIAAAICEGTSMAQSMGLGGGFFATVYIKETGKVYALNARETAPKAATFDMYYSNSNASKTGGLAVAVPGEIRGYQELHQRFGFLPWRVLFEPTIKLCRFGLRVNKYLAKLFKNNRDHLKNTPGFSDFIDPNTGEPYVEGQKIVRLKLAETLEIIASEPDALHDGSLTNVFVRDIHNLGGIITESDMRGYRPVWDEPIVVHLNKEYTMYSFPPPGSGVVLGHILGLLSNNLEFDAMNKVVNWQRIIEGFKFGYGMRTHLGDPLFDPSVADTAKKMLDPAFMAETRQKMEDNQTSQDPAYYGAQTNNVEDHGTAHINVLAPNGDAFVFTGTINLIYGAKVVSASTGIILNDEMDDFATQPTDEFGNGVSSVNSIAPGKRPQSSMCPSIILDNAGNVRMLVGGAGGSKITTATALVILRHLYFNQTLADAVQSPRMHHQLFPMQATYDPDFGQELLTELKQIGHIMLQESPDGFGAITSVANHSWIMEASSDPRRMGSQVMI